MVQFYLKNFNELNLLELHDLFALRSKVFVVEQDCVYLDVDGKDQQAKHILGFESGKLVAYARIFEKGITYSEYASIGRVVVSESHRSQNIGHQLITYSIQCIDHDEKESSIKISAQAHLEEFYNQHGFQKVGKQYLEDGIPHIAMVI
ncbi:MAG: GNAT family N-acetyltransferase [Flavobacteriaceae bacterium]